MSAAERKIPPWLEWMFNALVVLIVFGAAFGPLAYLLWGFFK